MANDQKTYEFKPDQPFIVTDQMVAAGPRIMLEWMDSDAPDIRVPVREILSIALAEHAACD